MFSRSPNFRAFTLIELLMVLAIIAIMVALIAPSLRGFAVGRKSDDVARQIVALTRYAQSQSISEGRPFRLNVDPTARQDQFWLTAQTGGQWVAPTNENGEKFSLPEGVKMDTDITRQPDGQYVTFSPTGRTEAASITLTDALNRTVVVACASATELFRIVPSAERSQ